MYSSNEENENFLDNMTSINPMASYIPNSFQQLDLNDAKNLVDLEDPTLIEHMANARQKLIDDENQRKATKLEIDILMGTAAKLLSSMTIKLKSTYSLLSTASENLILQNSNILKITNDEVPFGFPKIVQNSTKSIMDNFLHLNKKISPISDNVNETVLFLNNFEQELILLGRNYHMLVGHLSEFNDKLLKECPAYPSA